jgi:hypothetical protein
MYKENLVTDRQRKVMKALSDIESMGGKISDFRELVNEPNFSAVKYMHLIDLQRNGKATEGAIVKILSDTHIE